MFTICIRMVDRLHWGDETTKKYKRDTTTKELIWNSILKAIVMLRNNSCAIKNFPSCLTYMQFHNKIDTKTTKVHWMYNLYEREVTTL